jgi:hypothetical protein
MKNNLISPFVMREAGIKVSNIPKTQVTEPTAIEDHSICFPETGFKYQAAPTSADHDTLLRCRHRRARRYQQLPW